MSKASLYLIPNLLGADGNVDRSLPVFNHSIINQISHFAVEHIKDARRFLVKCDLKHKIDSSEFEEINKHSSDESYQRIESWLSQGHDVGIISDAGCPGIADPGSRLVEWAHQNQIKLVPLVGPSSIFLALMASGMNGQSFAFHGYLEKDNHQRKLQMKEMEVKCKKQTQIFMETPYRNEALFKELINTLNSSTELCIATDVTLKSEEIIRLPIQQWKKRKINLNKRPTIFLIGQSS